MINFQDQNMALLDSSGIIDTCPSADSCTSNELRMITCYYIRKLLGQYGHQLQSVVAVGAGVVADATADINQVLYSLYLEDMEFHLVTRELEVLVEIHQNLSSQKAEGLSVADQLAEIERRIFWILGLKRKPPVMG